MTHYLLGLEWSDQFLKIACFKESGKKYRLHKLAQLPLPSNDPERVADALGQWAEKIFAAESQVDVVIAIPESSIFLKELELPKVKEKGISEAINWEISPMLPFSVDEAVVQWQKIAEKEKTIRVGVIAVKEQTVQPLASIVKKLGFRLQAIEPSSLGFLRCSSAKFDKNTLLVITEDWETNFVILKNGVPTFSSTAPISLSRMKTKRKNLNKEVTKDLAANAKKVILYWEGKEKEKIQQVLVTGSGIRYYGLAQAINSLVHLPTNIGRLKSFEKIKIATFSPTIINRYLIPIGAAIKSVLPTQDTQINLLPKKEKTTLEKEKRQFQLGQRTLLFAQTTFVFLLIYLAALTGLRAWEFSINKDLNQTKLFVQNHPAQKLLPEIQNANLTISQVGWLLANQKNTGEKLRQIAKLVPANIQFNSLELKNIKEEEWQIAGVGDRQDILAFYKKLEVDSGAKQVSMPYSNLQKEKGADFKITVIW